MDWTDIPGNAHAFSRLRRLVQGGDAIAFVGAGTSAGMYPLWGNLIRELADEAVRRGRVDEVQRGAWLHRPDDHPDVVVRDIKAALGGGIFTAILREIFRPKNAPGGVRFTALHAALLRLPFKGYVTTNFDPALLEARRAVRSDSTATGFATWKDEDAVTRWNSGQIFRDEPCPVLFAHGISDRPDTIVLGADDYQEAYRQGPFSQLMHNMLTQAHLVFVGFSFSDQWFRFLADSVLVSGPKTRTDEPRHIAIMSLVEGEPYNSFERRRFESKYDAEPLFYPIAKRDDGSEDHGALTMVLETLGGTVQSAHGQIPTRRPSPKSEDRSLDVKITSPPTGTMVRARHPVQGHVLRDGAAVAGVTVVVVVHPLETNALWVQEACISDENGKWIAHVNFGKPGQHAGAPFEMAAFVAPWSQLVTEQKVGTWPRASGASPVVEVFRDL